MVGDAMEGVDDHGDGYKGSIADKSPHPAV